MEEGVENGSLSLQKVDNDLSSYSASHLRRQKIIFKMRDEHNMLASGKRIS
jgi:hypothetical protein